MKRKLCFIVSGCVLGIALMAEDPAPKIVGTWLSAATNALADRAIQTTSMETQYKANGTFTIKGQVGMTFPTNSSGKTYVMRNGVETAQESFTKAVGGNGVWHVDQGYLYWTVTNSTSIRTNVEHRYEIMSLDSKHFTYRNKNGRTDTATRKQ